MYNGLKIKRGELFINCRFKGGVTMNVKKSVLFVAIAAVAVFIVKRIGTKRYAS